MTLRGTRDARRATRGSPGRNLPVIEVPVRAGLQGVGAGRRLSGMTRLLLLALAAVISACAPSARTGTSSAAPADARDTLYYPPAGNWATRRAAEVGMDSAKLAAAVAFHLENESNYLRDLGEQVRLNTAREPYPDILGPTKPRTCANGVIIIGQASSRRTRAHSSSSSSNFENRPACASCSRKLLSIPPGI